MQAAAASGNAATTTTERCCICLSDVPEPAVLDSCAHSFCTDCILAWAERESTCPLCKRRFTSVTASGVARAVKHVTQVYVWDGVVAPEDEEELDAIVCDICGEGAHAHTTVHAHEMHAQP
jgi:hypothetical protein